MAKKRQNELLVGAFIVAGLVLFVLLIFLMGSLDFVLADIAIVEADFDDVQSLQAGDPVYVFGMKVGKVLSVRLLPIEESEKCVVRIELRMPMECRQRLRQNSRVKVDKSLTGTISVLIQEGDGPYLTEGGRLKGIPAADLSAVAEKVNEVLSEAEGLVKTISSMVKEIESKGTLTTAVSDLSSLIKDVRSEFVPLRDDLRQILSQIETILDENRLDLRHTLANLKETTGLAKSFTEKLAGTPELLRESLGEIEKAGESVKNILDENRTHIDTILQDLRFTATNAANLTAEIRRRPWRLLYQPSEDEEKAMDLYDAAWAYNLGATELNRSVRDLADQLKRAVRENYAGETLRDAEEKVRQSLRKHREAEDVFWERLRASE